MEGNAVDMLHLTCGCSAFNKKGEIKVKKLSEDAALPSRAHETDAGFDVVCVDDGVPAFSDDGKLLYLEYHTGIAIEPPAGYSVAIYPRSNISKYDLALANSIGLIDNSYRGEIILRFKVVGRPGFNSVPQIRTEDSNDVVIGARANTPDGARKVIENNFKVYHKGDKIGQLVIHKDMPNFSMVEVDEIDETKRGAGGFGSSDS